MADMWQKTRDGDGICKLVIDKEYRKLLGAHMIGNPASEIIYGAAFMIETQMRVDGHARASISPSHRFQRL